MNAAVRLLQRCSCLASVQSLAEAECRMIEEEARDRLQVYRFDDGSLIAINRRGSYGAWDRYAEIPQRFKRGES